MVKAIALWEREPDAERYERHAEIARRVPGAAFRHGKVFGSPFGQPDIAHYAEFDFPDKESFRRGTESPEFQETGKDALEFGIPLKIYFVEVE